MVKFFLSVKMRIFFFFYFFFCIDKPHDNKGRRRRREQKESNKLTRVGIHNGLEKKFQ